MVLPASQVTPESSPSKKVHQTSTPIASSVQRRAKNENFEVSAVSPAKDELDPPREQCGVAAADELSELSVLSLNQSQAVELALDTIEENNRLLRSKREMDSSYSQRTRAMGIKIEEVEKRLAGSELATQELQKQMELERHRAQTQVHDARIFMEEQLALMEQERLDFDEERKRYTEEIGRLECVIAGMSGVSSSLSVPNDLDASGSNDRTQLIRETFDQVRSELGALSAECSSIKSYVHSNTSDVDRQIGAAKEAVTDVQTVVGEQKLQIEALKTDKRTLLEQQHMVSVERSKLQSQLKQMKVSRRRQDEVDLRMAQLEANVLTATQDANEKKRYIDDLCSKLRHCQNELETRKTEVNHLREVGNRVQADGQQSASLHEELLEKTNQIEELRSDIEHMNAKMEAVRDVQTAYEAQRKAAEQAALRAEDKETALQTIQKKHVGLEQVLDETLREKEHLSGRLIAAQNKEREGEEQLDRLQREFDCWKENAQMQHEFEMQEINAKNEYLNEQLKKYENLPGKEPDMQLANKDANSVWSVLSSNIRDSVCRLSTEHEPLKVIVRELQSTRLRVSSAERLQNALVAVKQLISNNAEAASSRQVIPVLRCLESLLDELLHTVSEPSNLVKQFTDDLSKFLSSFAKPPSPPKENKDAKKFERECQRLTAEMASLTAEHANCADRQTEIEANARTIADLSARLNSIQNERRLLEHDLEKQIGINQDLDQKFQSHTRDLELLRLEIDEKEKTVADFRLTLEDRNDALEDLLQKYNALEETSEYLHKESCNTIAQMQQVLEAERLRCDRLAEELESLNGEKEQMRRKNIDNQTQEELMRRLGQAAVRRTTEQEKSMRLQIQSLEKQLLRANRCNKALCFQKQYVKSQNDALALRIIAYKERQRRDMEYLVRHRYVQPSVPSTPRPSSPKSKFRIAVWSVIAARRFGLPRSSDSEVESIKDVPMSTPIRQPPRTGPKAKENRMPSRVLKDRNDNVFDADLTPIKA